jgi:hypothetical protein
MLPDSYKINKGLANRLYRLANGTIGKVKEGLRWIASLPLPQN